MTTKILNPYRLHPGYSNKEQIMTCLKSSCCIFLFFVLSTTGCTMLGPDYQVPTAPVQSQWLEHEDPLIDTKAPVTSQWWGTAFNDPVLNHLVDIALSQNLSLRSAGLRILQARQRLAIAVGSQFPQQQQLSGTAEIEGDNHSSFELYDLEFNLSWEADVWGRFKRQIESASASLDASVANYDGVMISLIAGVAQNYLMIRTTQQQIIVTQENISLQAESLRITTEKHNAGEVSSLDMDQAQTLLYNTKASLSSLRISLQQLKNNLSILLGQPPNDMSMLLVKVMPVPSSAPGIAIGMPQDLIRKRPDVRLAERQLAAQSAQIGFAMADLYPHFGIGGSIGTSTSTDGDKNFGDLFTADSFGYGLLGFFQWDILNYGRLKNNVRLQDAIFQQLLEDYRQTLLQAQGEVENAIVAFLMSQVQLKDYGLATDAALRASAVSMTQYQEGMVGFNTVISTLKSLVSQQFQLISTQGVVANNLVEVYKSLGGGWEIRQNKDNLELIPVETKRIMQERTKAWKGVFSN
jgi:NodT family efflux transporter outer membrane factor (OMF) lipoprotein